MNSILPPGLNYVPPVWIYGPPHGYHDPEWEEKAKLSGLQTTLIQLEDAASKAKKRHTLDIIFNQLAACNAAIAAIVLSRS